MTHFAYDGAEPAYYRSPPVTLRGFCSACGSTLTMQYDSDTSYIDIAAGTLDFPALIHPERHIWHREALPWAALADDLPRYTEEFQKLPPT